MRMTMDSDSMDERVVLAKTPLKKSYHGEGQSPPRSLRILVVGDEQHVTDRLCANVSSWGHQARKSYNGLSGLAEANEHAPHVVLLDTDMPGMDGYELARRLRQSADLHRCYVIAMRPSGYHRGSARLEFTIDLFLAKPMNLAVLETLMRMEGDRLDRLT